VVVPRGLGILEPRYGTRPLAVTTEVFLEHFFGGRLVEERIDELQCGLAVKNGFQLIPLALEQTNRQPELLP
jgi:hypothetical protein